MLSCNWVGEIFSSRQTNGNLMYLALLVQMNGKNSLNICLMWAEKKTNIDSFFAPLNFITTNSESEVFFCANLRGKYSFGMRKFKGISLYTSGKLADGKFNKFLIVSRLMSNHEQPYIFAVFVVIRHEK